MTEPQPLLIEEKLCEGSIPPKRGSSDCELPHLIPKQPQTGVPLTGCATIGASPCPRHPQLLSNPPRKQGWGLEPRKGGRPCPPPPPHSSCPAIPCHLIAVWWGKSYIYGKDADLPDSLDCFKIRVNHGPFILNFDVSTTVVELRYENKRGCV